jgi:hypothetical protein
MPVRDERSTPMIRLLFAASIAVHDFRALGRLARLLRRTTNL